MSTDDPLLWTAAKAVAEQRQHGCHYAEGACAECVALAEAALRAVITKEPDDRMLNRMAHAARTGANMRFAYQAMPVWQVLWRFDENEISEAPEQVEIRSIACIAGCGRYVEYEVREFGPQSSFPPAILCDACAVRGKL